MKEIVQVVMSTNETVATEGGRKKRGAISDNDKKTERPTKKQKTSDHKHSTKKHRISMKKDMTVPTIAGTHRKTSLRSTMAKIGKAKRSNKVIIPRAVIARVIRETACADDKPMRIKSEALDLAHRMTETVVVNSLRTSSRVAVKEKRKTVNASDVALADDISPPYPHAS